MIEIAAEKSRKVSFLEIADMAAIRAADGGCVCCRDCTSLARTEARSGLTAYLD